MSRMSNTAEILAKQFRQHSQHRQIDDDNINNNNVDNVDNNNQQRIIDQWSLKRFVQDFFGLKQQMSNNIDEMNELFWRIYLKKLQINFFIWLLLLNIFFNIITIIVAIYHQNFSCILFPYFSSLIVFGMFLFVIFFDENLLQPEFSRSLASITVLITMIVTEYGHEFLQLNHLSINPLRRIRPLHYILIANNLLLPFSSRMMAAISSFIIIVIEIIISLAVRFNLCENQHIIIRLAIGEIISYVYTAIFGLYIKGLLEKIVRRTFENYIESKYNIYKLQKEHEEILKSCLPQHLIDRVRKDLKETIKVIDQQGKITSRRFKKLYIKKYDNVSILFADIVNSVALTEKLSANELVETLDNMFGTFDKCADKNNCLRIKLLGDCYYCVSGLPIPDSNHAWNSVRMGFDMIKIINELRKSKNIDINMRIGIHSGMVQSGIIGMHKWQFDIWSMDCLLASQMEQDGVPGCLHITKKTFDLLPKDKLSQYKIVEKITNENIGYLISMINNNSKKQQKFNQKISSINELSLKIENETEKDDQILVEDISNNEHTRVNDDCKIQMSSSFSKIDTIKRINSSNSNKSLTFCVRNGIWIIVNILLLVNSLHDLILYNCKMEQKEMITQTALKQFDSANCPYIWSFTMCTILSMTGISIFITINLWFKFILRTIGLFCFIAILLNDCSLYQSIIPRIENEKQWISNIGFDPIMSHLYYLLMVIIILTIIDREIEYVFRLEFRMRKKEKQDDKINVEINEILLKNILPAYIVREYLTNDSRLIKPFYSESYRFCAVMFASIPNYSEFYSENEINQHGKNCLRLLNEIICDFDVLLSCPEFQKIEKIKTIGSTYMAAAGLQPGRLSLESNNVKRKLIINLICFAMGLMKKLQEINKNTFQDLKLRIGISVGPVIAGIVGNSKPQYDIWGDTVNVASRMESTGVMGRIQMTEKTANIICMNDEYENLFTLEKRGPIPVKGKGNLITYLAKTEFDFDEPEISL
uniref:adenylate cyclase n=1 Tax=Dermatophagoides pteronyssinus TaxID=6956 RepID=A0A6P6XW88_DERPT|nr:adenylate cyclase type 2-like [Dermatophagoides pteronyssinus]